jgi:hypothetical protein
MVQSLRIVSPLLGAQSAKVSLSPQLRIDRLTDNRFNIPIPTPHLTPLSQLINTLTHQTGLDPSKVKLIYKGAVLKDPSLTISSYGITDDSTLVLIGSEDKVIPQQQTKVINKKNKQPETDSEDVLVDWINQLIHNTLDPLTASIATFKSQVDVNATNKPSVIPPFEVLQKEHARLSEMLLRGLLDLDGVEIRSEWTRARAARKEGVKKVQGELTKVDEAWGARKKL